MTYNPGKIWDNRAKLHGKNCVMDLSLTDGERSALTALQKEILLHRLDRAINYTNIGTGLDFGCGTGRFTAELAMRCEYLWCYDPSPKVVELARREHAAASWKSRLYWETGELERFFYRSGNDRFSWVWASLVFGGIPDKELPALAYFLGRTVVVGGALLFADHVSETHYGSSFWRFRPVTQYLNLFQGFKCRLVDSYVTRGQTVGVFEAKREK